MKQKVFCIQHPHYDGTGSPVLSCRTCCAIFISRIKKDNGDETGTSAHKSDEESSQPSSSAKDTAQKKAPKNRKTSDQSGADINPEWI